MHGDGYALGLIAQGGYPETVGAVFDIGQRIDALQIGLSALDEGAVLAGVMEQAHGGHFDSRTVFAVDYRTTYCMLRHQGECAN